MYMYICTNTSLPPSGLAVTLITQGNLHRELGNLVLSLEYLKRSMDIMESLYSSSPHPQVKCNMCVVHSSFYGLQGHPYDCFPMSLVYVYILYMYVCVTYVYALYT